MIRRNSAIEKRSASTLSTPNISASNTAVISSSTTNSAKTPNVVPYLSHLNTTACTSDDQSISPALSSSTTTSPMTPMTPISPHIPSGYQSSDISVHPQLFFKNSPSSSTSISCSQHPPIHHLHSQHSHSLHHNAHAKSMAMHSWSSPKEIYQKADGLPKLPPKPSLSYSLCDNP
ncbi:hypothetical protein DOY81_007482, partial [Sarcophaga bullata]